jgi:protein phosphatase 1L
MSDTPTPCEVLTVEATSAGKLDLVENDECTVPNGSAPNGSLNAQAIEDSHATEEDNGEASDETSSRRESNGSAEGNVIEELETLQTNDHEDHDNTNINLPDTTTRTTRKKKKKRRSRPRNKSRQPSRSNSYQSLASSLATHHDTPNSSTDTETEITTQDQATQTPLIIETTEATEVIEASDTTEATDATEATPATTPTITATTTATTDPTPEPTQEPTTEPTITAATTPNDAITETSTPDNANPQPSSEVTFDTDITIEINEGSTPKGDATEGEGKSDTADKLPTDKDTALTTDTNTDTTNDDLPSISSGDDNSSSSTSTTTTHANIEDIPDLPDIPDILPATRGRSNAFYGNKLPPPLIHSHSDGAAIIAQYNASSISPRRNISALGLEKGGVTVTPTIPEPAHSGLSKPKMFTWRNFAPAPPDKSILSHSKRFLVGFAETIGRRPSMEDCMVVHGAFRGHGQEDYFALFDGHGGKDAAIFAAENLHLVLAEKLKTNNAVKSLKEAFLDTNKMISDQKVIGGTTAVVVLFMGKKGFIANVGDTRAVLCRDGVPCRVSLDHKPELPTETSRIRKLGGTVTTSYNSVGHATSRVNGMLSVSRALGDTQLQPYVSSDPEIHGPLNLDTDSRNQFVVLACDGVWDVLTDEEATSIVAPIANPEIASRRLRDEAFARGSTDNISVMVIRCPPFIPCD